MSAGILNDVKPYMEVLQLNEKVNIDMSQPFAVSCPKGCHHRGWASDSSVIMVPIRIKDPELGLVIGAIKCNKCGFEAYASKEMRDKYGKHGQPYWNGSKIEQAE